MAAVEATGVALAHRGALPGHAAEQMLFPLFCGRQARPSLEKLQDTAPRPSAPPFHVFSLFSFVYSLEWLLIYANYKSES